MKTATSSSTASTISGNSASVEELLQSSPELWRGCHPEARDRDGFRGVTTGYPELDAVLPGHGWPRNAMMEIITPYWGMGELQLLLPLMRSVTGQGKWILWISPPYLLYAPALVKAGIDTRQILVMQMETSCRDALWSMEKALQTENCGLVLAWQNWLPHRVIRRLQLAAEGGQTLGVLFHHHESKDSPSALRLSLNACRNSIGKVDYRHSEIQIRKSRGTYNLRTYGQRTVRITLNGGENSAGK
ncbi:MAG: translesion DNA synthesis-associated protein ImuA [Pseudohongiellaceae bacterium]